ncbi:MAG: exodeoxyribonuclease VII large subunit [Lachnospiraceae bacterium]|nr:exodeoxyribonuclease VII large subunit [Lachnospiraceae bacterium]
MANVYSVTQVNNYIKNMFTQDFLLQDLSIQGEVSNCKYHSSGHIYFTLKDSGGTIACIMFAGFRKGLEFRLEEGQKIVVTGSVDVYERDGRYQLYAKEIRLAGLGQLFERFEALKAELQEMGMFAQEYKHPIPKYIRTLGVVTASTGAAVRDIIQIAMRRNPFVQIILYPAQVQGEGAAESIVKGIHALEAMQVDVMIVGRGGGSIEDLWAFNERIVAEAVFHCSVPVISAVGHETDTTIIDFVSDLRAPTPSAAAELAVYDVVLLRAQLESYEGALSSGMYQKLDYYRRAAEHYKRLLQMKHPAHQIREQRHRLMVLEERLQSAMRHQIEARRTELKLKVSQLKGLSPLEKLEQGLSYVAFKDGSAVHSVEQVEEGTALRIQLKDGRVFATVTGKEHMDVKEKYGCE